MLRLPLVAAVLFAAAPRPVAGQSLPLPSSSPLRVAFAGATDSEEADEGCLRYVVVGVCLVLPIAGITYALCRQAEGDAPPTEQEALLRERRAAFSSALPDTPGIEWVGSAVEADVVLELQAGATRRGVGVGGTPPAPPLVLTARDARRGTPLLLAADGGLPASAVPLPSVEALGPLLGAAMADLAAQVRPGN